MSPSNNDDLEHLQRIRDRQIADRDPSGTRQKYSKQYGRQTRSRKPTTMKGVLNVFPNWMKGAFLGVIVGFIAWVVMSVTLDAAWVDWAGLAAVVILAGIGAFVGSSFDWRDDLRDF